jgi:hypothetical protein
MLFSDESFDAETRGAMNRALDAAWKDLMEMLQVDPIDSDAMRDKLVRRITAAARNGERDANRLKMFALGII